MLTGFERKKGEATLCPNAVLVHKTMFCVGFFKARGACAQPAHNLAPKPFSQTSGQASFQGQGGEGNTQREKSNAFEPKK